MSPWNEALNENDSMLYDYIVVGAGSSGCVVAGELSSNPSLHVLVLECGDLAETESLLADQYKKAFVNDRLMWERYSIPQKECANHRIYLGSGKGLGGSGSVNGMVYTRGSEFDYLTWPAKGWRWKDLVPTFEKVEKKLKIMRQPETLFTKACIRAAKEAGFVEKKDLNDGKLSRFLGYNWMNISGNERRSSYVAFLRPNEQQANLRIHVRSLVRRVLFDAHRKAIGVEYEQEGRVRVAHVRCEVILAAGALETPKLLMLSGIGSKTHLTSLGIPVVAHLPAVGTNLMDHPNVGIFFKGHHLNDCSWAQLYGFHRANPGSTLPEGEADTCYVFYSARSSFREGVIRLLPGMILPEFLYRWRGLRSALRGVIKIVFSVPCVHRLIERMYGIIVILGKPKSRGTVRLRSADPRDPAIIDPNYLGDPEDMETLIQGVELARKIVSSLKDWGNTEMIPGSRIQSRKKLERFVRKNIMTTYHFAGTCAMGDGEESVVDTRLRVKGVSGLRVADASVAPSVPVSAMNAPSMMIGYRAAQLILEDNN